MIIWKILDHCLATFCYLIPLLTYIGSEPFLERGAFYVGICWAFGLQLFVRSVVEYRQKQLIKALRDEK